MKGELFVSVSKVNALNQRSHQECVNVLPLTQTYITVPLHVHTFSKNNSYCKYYQSFEQAILGLMFPSDDENKVFLLEDDRRAGSLTACYLLSQAKTVKVRECEVVKMKRTEKPVGILNDQSNL